MLQDTQAYFIELLRSHIHGRKPAAREHTDWQALYTLSRRQSLSGMLYMISKQLTGNGAPPADLCEKLEQDYWKTVRVSTCQEAEMRKIEEAFTKEEIEFMPVKGYCLKREYPVPDLRTMGDIDILIHDEAQEAAKKRLVQLGFAWEYVNASEQHFVKRPVYLEVHTMLLYQSPNREELSAMEEPWSHAAKQQGSRWELSASCHLLYLFYHLSKHLLHRGCGIRQVLDIAVFFTHEKDIDWDYLAEHLEQSGLTRFAAVVLGYCSTVLEVRMKHPLPVIEDALLFDDITCFLLGCGTFGQGASRLLFQQRKRYREEGKSHTFIPLLFPSYGVMCRRFRYVRGRKWMLPFAYLHRGIAAVYRGRRLRWKESREAGVRAREESDFYREIGL